MKHGWKDGMLSPQLGRNETVSSSLTELLDKTPYDITVTPLLDDRTGRGSQVLHICSSGGGKSWPRQ